MRAEIAKWGDDWAVRLPKEAAEKLGAREGGSVELAVEGDCVEIRRSSLSPELGRRRWIGVPGESDEELNAAVDQLHEVSKRNRLGSDLSISELIEAGRRF